MGVGHVALHTSFATFTFFPSTSISSSAMCNQPNDYFLEFLWSFKKAVARLWWPEPRLANLNSVAANLHPSSTTPILRTASSANRAVDAGPTGASEVPDNPAAHRVTICDDHVKHHIVETEDRAGSGLCPPNISFTVANKSYIVTTSVYPPTSTTYLSNLLMDRGLASVDNDSHVLKHQSVNIGNTNDDCSTTVPLDTEIFPAISTVDDAKMTVACMISLIFLWSQYQFFSDQNLQVTRLEAHHMRLSNLCNSLFLSCLVCGLEILLYNVIDGLSIDGSSHLPIMDPPKMSSGEYHN